MERAVCANPGAIAAVASRPSGMPTFCNVPMVEPIANSLPSRREILSVWTVQQMACIIPHQGSE
jgi:hypothetical protein